MAVEVELKVGRGGGRGGTYVAHPNNRKMADPSLLITYHRKRQGTDVLIYTISFTLVKSFSVLKI
jgi:hypothetical protein